MCSVNKVVLFHCTVQVNNRGKPLSTFEKLKNFLLLEAQRSEGDTADVTQFQNRLSEVWAAVFRELHRFGCLDEEEEDSFLREVCTVLIEPKLYKTVDRGLISELKEHFEGNGLAPMKVFVERLDLLLPVYLGLKRIRFDADALCWDHVKDQVPH